MRLPTLERLSATGALPFRGRVLTESVQQPVTMICSRPKSICWLLGSLLLFAFGGAPGALASQDDPASNARIVAGVYVHEKAGALSPAEEALLRRLHDKMIPLPDTVRIRRDSVHFGVYSLLDGEIVYLSTDRFRAPNSLSRTAPYLFGRVEASEPVGTTALPRYTHTLAHEIAHFIGARLATSEPRPAWGTARSLRGARRAREIEAELIAAVLQREVFGTRLSALGYPRSVDIHGVGLRSTRALLQEYRGIIADTWRLRALGMGPS